MANALTPASIQIRRQSPEDTIRALGTNGSRIYRDAAERGMNLSQYLENTDPTSEREADDRALDAFERLVRATGIVLAPVPEIGLFASTWQECLETPERRALMPEFMSRVWRRAQNLDPVSQARLAMAQSGMSDGSDLQTRAVLMSGDAALGGLINPWYDNPEIRAKRLVPPIPLARLVARTTAIDTDAYRTLYITDDFGTDAYRMKRVAEGTEIPRTSLVTGEHTLRIYKFGRALQATYEQLRRQRVDRIAFIIARMAIQSEMDKVTIAMNTIINGDGNANTAATVLTQTGLHPGSTAGTLTLQSFLTFKLRFALTYQPDIILGQEAPIMQMLLLPVSIGVQTPYAMIPANAFGTVSPLANQLSIAMEYGVTADAPASKLVALQSSAALERVTEVGGNVSEVDRFINNQTQLLTITEVEGYGIIDPNSSRILNIAA